MKFGWYVMETDGNGAIRQANIKIGPYYNEKEWFDPDGYGSREDAESAIREYCKENGSHISLYILEGI